jgi:hypothetical protein
VVLAKQYRFSAFFTALLKKGGKLAGEPQESRTNLEKERFEDTTLTEAKILIKQWRKEYNHVRPNSALRYRPPVPEATMPVIVPMELTYQVV